jgi:2-dehydropantoate 2-reductase
VRIAILGSGGVGGYFGGRLASKVGSGVTGGAEVPQVDVTFIARGAHLAALRQHGLRVLSPLGDLHIPQVNATDDPASVGPVDIVFFTVKLYDTESALQLLPPLVGPQTLVVPFQNGVDSVSVLTRSLGREHVAGGTTYVSAVIDEPGVIRHTAMNRLVFGALDPAQVPLLESLRTVAVAAGIDAVRSERIMTEIWVKFCRLTVFSGMTAMTRCPLGIVMNDPDLFAMFQAALRESLAVARGRQIALPDTAFDDMIAGHRALPPGAKSSMLEDLERGRPLELPWLSGAVVRIGEEVHVDTPTHRLIVTLLRPHQAGRQLGARA